MRDRFRGPDTPLFLGYAEPARVGVGGGDAAVAADIVEGCEWVGRYINDVLVKASQGNFAFPRDCEILKATTRL